MGLLELIIAILVIFWLVGFFVAHIGGLIHLLLVVALIALIFRLVRGRTIVDG